MTWNRTTNCPADGSAVVDSGNKQHIMLSMMTTLDISDALYRRFKMKTAMSGETIRNATLAFITSYVNGRAVGLDGSGVPLERDEKDSDLELPAWAGLAAPYIRKNLDGPHDMESIRRSISERRKSMRSR